MSDRRVMHVISHTHWDREWYFTLQDFRTRLVDLIDALLDLLDRDPGFRTFHLDGQTVVLEDYLEVRPEREADLRRLIKDGRILIGPWYLLNDEFLTSGEATVRNLQIGRQICEDYGSNMRIGYLPDQFGNIGQMPQILAGFGIDTAVFGRGWQLVDDRKCEFLWRAPDGSEALTSFMVHWYNNLQRIPEDPDEGLAFVERARDALDAVTHTGQLLMMNGVDHLFAQENLAPILESLRGRLPETDEIRHSTLPDYFEAVRAEVAERGIELGVHDGELREDRHGQILAGTLSTRMYLKQANDACQRLLERVTEPLATMASVAASGAYAYPESFLLIAWKHLLQNHPHDSICGCSIDHVHVDMKQRFRDAEQIGRLQSERALTALAQRLDTSAAPEGAATVVVANPLPWERTDPVTVVVDFPMPDAPHAVKVLDAAGEEVPAGVVEVKATARRIWSPIALPKSEPVRRFVLSLVAEAVPATGLKTLHIAPAGWQAPEPPELLIDPRTVENEYLRVTVEPNGGLTLLDKVTGYTYRDLLTIEESGDVGDEYRYLAPVADRTYTTHGCSPSITVLESGPARVRIEIRGVFEVPEASTSTGRATDLVGCGFRTVLSVSRGVPRVDVETTITNAAKDHRVRVAFPTDLETDVAQAEGQYDVVTRSRPPAEWPHATQCQPQQGFVAAGDGHRGLCIVNQGMPEYELGNDARRTLYLTLFRAVGALSRGGEAAVVDLTPGAQMLGEYTFGYSIVPFAGDLLTSYAPRQAHQARVPLETIQTDSHEGDIEDGWSLLSLAPECLIHTATKRSPDGEHLVVRCFNPRETAVDGELRISASIRAAWTGDLMEKPVEELGVEEGVVRFTAGPKRIVTLLLALGE